jgi:hypothetical protein
MTVPLLDGLPQTPPLGPEGTGDFLVTGMSVQGLPGAARPRCQAGDNVVVAPSDHVAGLAALLAAASVPPCDIMGGDAPASGCVPELGLVALDVGPEVDDHLPARPAFPDEGRPGERRSPG